MSTGGDATGPAFATTSGERTRKNLEHCQSECCHGSSSRRDADRSIGAGCGCLLRRSRRSRHRWGDGRTGHTGRGCRDGRVTDADDRNLYRDDRTSHNHRTTNHRTTNHRTTNHRTTNHRTTNHRTTNHRTTNHRTTNHRTTNHRTTNHRTTNHRTTNHRTTNHRRTDDDRFARSHVALDHAA